MKPETMPNPRPEVCTNIKITLPLPACCPVSGNPQEGSTITITYQPSKKVLEVYSLEKYLASFVNGHPDGERTMEGMIQQITQDYARALYVPVHAAAHLKVNGIEMSILSTATPEEETP